MQLEFCEGATAPAQSSVPCVRDDGREGGRCVHWQRKSCIIADPGAKLHPGVPPLSRWPCNTLTNPDLWQSQSQRRWLHAPPPPPVVAAPFAKLAVTESRRRRASSQSVCHGAPFIIHSFITFSVSFHSNIVCSSTTHKHIFCRLPPPLFFFFKSLASEMIFISSVSPSFTKPHSPLSSCLGGL